MPAPSERKILIADDHPVVRRGLRQLIDSEPDLTVCAEAKNAGEALTRVGECMPDLAVLDLSMEGTNGIELTHQLQAHHPELPVLIVSMHDEALYAERALSAGARGYVMKRTSNEELLRGIRRVLDGQVYLSEDMREQLFPLHVENGAVQVEEEPVGRLSDRELQVFRLMGEGYAPRHIAEELSLSVKTVETYRRHLKQKLHVDSAEMLRRYAVRWYKDHQEN